MMPIVARRPRSQRGHHEPATFRAIARKYPHKPPEEILRDLIKSTPGTEGKWFAAAKDAGHLDLAIELAQRSPTDLRIAHTGCPGLRPRPAGVRRSGGIGCSELDLGRSRLRDHRH